MKVIILNSGLGTRMGGLTQEIPKCLVELNNGETVLSRQIDFFLQNNIGDFIITTGPFAHKIENYLGERYQKTPFTYIHNPLYDSTNYIYSLHLAGAESLKSTGGAESEETIILMHGDLVFTHAAPLKLIKSTLTDTVLVDESPSLPEKDFKCRIKDGLIVKIAVDLLDSDCRFLFPMYKLRASTYKKWLNKMSDFVAAGNTKVYAENALNEILPETPLKPFYYSQEFCAEVDDEEDLKKAREVLI